MGLLVYYCCLGNISTDPFARTAPAAVSDMPVQKKARTQPTRRGAVRMGGIESAAHRYLERREGKLVVVDEAHFKFIAPLLPPCTPIWHSRVLPGAPRTGFSSFDFVLVLNDEVAPPGRVRVNVQYLPAWLQTRKQRVVVCVPLKSSFAVSSRRGSRSAGSNAC